MEMNTEEYDKGYQSGYSNGEQCGYDRGHAEGHAEGFDLAWEEAILKARDIIFTAWEDIV